LEGGGGNASLFGQRQDSAVGVSRDVIADFHRPSTIASTLHTIDADQRAGHAGNQNFVFIGTDTFAHYHPSLR